MKMKKNYYSDEDIPEADLSDMMKEEDVTRRIGEEEDMMEEQRERFMKLKKVKSSNEEQENIIK